MGCVGGKLGGKDNKPIDRKAVGKENQQLLDEYTLGDVLGQGTFGVVYACALKGQTDFKFAAKIVDKVESPVTAIKREAEMMRELEHTNVVQFHELLYFQRRFVCIVMDRYNGGDLIHGMQHHWETKGNILPGKVVHIVRQITQAVKHLHLNLYVHRDLKGDNFLIDRKDITDPECRVLMSDLGTCVKLKNKLERLRAPCGTKTYWAPEFYSGDYSFKVDVWAIGVVIYGLLKKRFPFQGEQDVRKKQIRLPATTPTVLEDFLQKLLAKKEKDRLDAEQAAAHAWLREECAGRDGGKCWEGEQMEGNTGFGEGGANATQNEHVQDKRSGKSTIHMLDYRYIEDKYRRRLPGNSSKWYQKARACGTSSAVGDKDLIEYE